MTILGDWLGVPGDSVLAALLSLLPGLVTVAIIYALTVRQSLSPLERAIQALLFTFLNHVIWQIILVLVHGIVWLCTWSWGKWFWQPPDNIALIGLGLCGVGTGLLMTWLINVGQLHEILRTRLKLTERTSRPNEWYDAFYMWKAYVVIHLNDGRRIFGWPQLYPDCSEHGHVVLADAEWLEKDQKVSKAAPRLRIMVKVQDVRFVEFIPEPTAEPKDETDGE